MFFAAACAASATATPDNGQEPLSVTFSSLHSSDPEGGALTYAWDFNGETVTLVNVHSTSRGGSDPLFGNQQPPRNEGDAARLAQSQAVDAYIDALQAADPGADVMVLGDFNAFYFEQSVELLEGGLALVRERARLAGCYPEPSK